MHGSTPRPSLTRPAWTLGDAPRYFSDLRAPGYKNFDLSIQKYFPIKESVRLQFRLDMFNAFNHTNFYSPNTFIGGWIRDHYSSMDSEADAGSSQALLVIRGANNQGCL